MSLDIIKPSESAVQGKFQVFDIKPSQCVDLESEMEFSLPVIERILEDHLNKFNALKFYTVFNVKMRKTIEETPIVVGFYSKTRTLYIDDDILDTLNKCKTKILDSADAFNRKGMDLY